MAVIENPLGGLIEGVLQGHAIATQLKHQAMQEEAFQRAQARDAQESQLRDMEAQMKIQSSGRPVTGNMIEQSFEAPGTPAPPGSGLPDTSPQRVSYARPVDKSRLLSYKTSDGRTVQSEAYTPEEFAQRASAMKYAEAFGSADIAQQIKEHNRRQDLQAYGVPVDPLIVSAGLRRPGELVLPEEQARELQEAQKLLSPEYKAIPEGTALYEMPKRVVGTGTPLTPGQQDFVNSAKAAGGAQAGQPRLVASTPEKATGDLERSYLPAFAAQHGLTPEDLKKPENAALMLQGVTEYAKRTQNPAAIEMMNQLHQATLSLAQERLAQLRASRTGTAQDIPEDSRDYRIAKQLAYGTLTLQQFSRLYNSRNPAMQSRKLDIYDKAQEINNNFNPAQFEMGFHFASNPKIQQQLASMDNVTRGVKDLLKFSDQASRSGITQLNKLVIPGGIAVGGKPYSNFHAAQIGFADELSGALGFGGATDMSRQMGLDLTNPNLSPENFRSAVEQVVVPFIERKRQSFLDQMGVYGLPGMNPAAPAANPAAPAAGAKLPDGGGKVLDDATAAQFYTAGGNDPAKARELAIQSHWKVK